MIQDTVNGRKSAINENEQIVGSKQKTIHTISTSLSVDSSKMEYNANSGDTIQLSVSGDAISSGTVHYYVKYVGSSSFTGIGGAAYNNAKTLTLNNDIDAVAVYINGNLSTEKILIITVKNVTHGIAAELTRIDTIVSRHTDSISELNDITTEEEKYIGGK